MSQSYSSQLKGWALDISSRMLCKGDKVVKPEELMEYADKLVAYAFVPSEAENAIREDIEKEIHYHETIAALAMKPASNAADKLNAAPTENPQ